MDRSPHPLPPWRLDAGILIVSGAILLGELLLTRIYSVTMFYHFSFLAVSIAMMGLGAGGLIVTLWPDLFPAASLPRTAGVGMIFFAVAAALLAWDQWERVEPGALSGSIPRQAARGSEIFP